MRISALTHSIQTEFRKIDAAKKNDKVQNSSKAAITDLSHISADGQRLSSAKSSIDAIASSLAVQDEIRSEKISEVQEKIKNGYYNSPEFIDKLADKLLAEFGMKPPA